VRRQSLPQLDEFARTWEERYLGEALLQGRIVRARIVAISSERATLSFGHSGRGEIALEELEASGVPVIANSCIDVFAQSGPQFPNGVRLSYARAIEERRWRALERALICGATVKGTLVGRRAGGFAIDVEGRIAFLPAREAEDVKADALQDIHRALDFAIIKLERWRNNIVVSRRAVLEPVRAAARQTALAKIKVGDVVTGTVKNVTDYGAFLDVGGVDGLLHSIEMSWKRNTDPRQFCALGERLKVKIIAIDATGRRVSLSAKALTRDPWADVLSKHPAGARRTGTVTNTTDYGAFVELEPGIEGLLHKSEIVADAHGASATELLAGQQITVSILSVDADARRISLTTRTAK